jgi:hypothetical protein
MRNGTECRFGTLYDQQTMAVISGSGYLIYFGCFAATLSSAIASLVGKLYSSILDTVGTFASLY